MFSHCENKNKQVNKFTFNGRETITALQFCSVQTNAQLCAGVPHGPNDARFLFECECSSNTAKKVQATFNLTLAIVLDAD